MSDDYILSLFLSEELSMLVSGVETEIPILSLLKKKVKYEGGRERERERERKREREKEREREIPSTNAFISSLTLP